MAENEQILLADDSKTVRNALHFFLTEDGHTVTTAESVEKVKQLIDQGTPFTLALLDNTMSAYGDGKIAAAYIESKRPGARIASLSTDLNVTFGRWNIDKNLPASKLVSIIKALPE